MIIQGDQQEECKEKEEEEEEEEEEEGVFTCELGGRGCLHL